VVELVPDLDAEPVEYFAVFDLRGRRPEPDGFVAGIQGPDAVDIDAVVDAGQDVAEVVEDQAVPMDGDNAVPIEGVAALLVPLDD
jgi:hypothetical protein